MEQAAKEGHLERTAQEPRDSVSALHHTPWFRAIAERRLAAAQGYPQKNR